jgi:hypothetical protein
METSEANTESREQGPLSPPPSDIASIDIEKLTDRVYRLMQAELRQDLARQNGFLPVRKT